MVLDEKAIVLKAAKGDHDAFEQIVNPLAYLKIAYMIAISDLLKGVYFAT